MKNSIEVSIVTISFNSIEYIEECIRSVNSQLTKNVEYIVVDGGSDDGTLQILRKYKSIFSTLIVEDDRGPANALNKGFQSSRGRFVFYLNSDDYLLPGAIDNMLKIVRNTSSDIIYGSALMLTEKGSRKIISDRWNLWNYVSGRCMIVQHSTLVRRKVYCDLRFGFNENNFDNWDGELLVDLALNGAKFERHKFLLAVFRVHDNSITGKQLNRDSLKATRERIRSKAKSSRSWSTYEIFLARIVSVLDFILVKPQRFINGFFIY